MTLSNRTVAALMIGVLVVGFAADLEARPCDRSVTFCQQGIRSRCWPGYQRIFEPGRYTYSHGCEERIRNDFYCSIIIPPRCEVVVYEHANYNGRRRRFRNPSFRYDRTYDLGWLAGRASSWTIRTF